MAQPPSNTQNLHDLLSARHFSTLADRDADTNVPTVTVTPAENDAPEPEQEVMTAPIARKAGRPRLDAAGAAVLSEDRRKQVRRAQRTYRLKKEATLQQTKQRVVDLEKKLDRVSSSFADLMQSLKPSDRATNPALARRLDAIYALLGDGPGGESSRGSSESHSHIDDSHSLSLSQSHTQNQNQADPTHLPIQHPSSTPSPPNHLYTIPPPPQTLISSYSHHEKTFTRRLHRLSLEHAFHLFSDPRSHPLKIYQVFRLVPCIQDKSKMDPYFRRLVSAGPDEALELSSLPFYCVGGAGTHYPDLDALGRPVYPGNRRLPRRVLGGLPVDLAIGGGLEWRTGGEGDRKGGNDEERRLQAYGLGGAWFDCRDVEGYLKEMGVKLDRDVVAVQEGEGNDGAAEQLQVSLLDSVEKASDVEEPSPDKVSRRMDIDSFLSKLLQGLVILGRAPGFRRRDVVSAFHAALCS